MTVTKLRAVAAAMLLGSAVLCAAPALAVVHAAVGNALKEAQTAAAAGRYKEAMAAVARAEAAPNKTPDEVKFIEQEKQYIAVKSGDASIGGALGAKAKFANDANARRYKDVIADGDMLRKSGALDGQSMLVIAQAYWQSGDKQGCLRYIKQSFGSSAGEAALQLQQRCAYDAGDDVAQREALEALVARTGKPEYWASLLKLSERSHGMTDHNTFDVYRLKMMTGSLTSKDDYILLAQLALQLNCPAEAQSVLEKGIAAKIVPTGGSTDRLLALAKSQAAASLAGQGKALAAANGAPQGDALVKIGEDQIGQGNAKGAIDTIKAGLAKPLKDQANGQIRLGQAYLAAGQKDAALKAFAAVKTPEKDAMVAHLWSLSARR